MSRTDPVLGCSLPTAQLCPDLVLLLLCSCNNVLSTALRGNTVGLLVNPDPLHACISPTQSLCFCLLPPLSVSFSLCLSLFPMRLCVPPW